MQNNRGELAFKAGGAIIAGKAGRFAVIAANGEMPPGGSEAFAQLSSANSSLTFSDDSRVAFTSSPGSNVTSLWIAGGGQLQKVIRTGDVAPGLPGETITSVRDVLLNANDQVVFEAVGSISGSCIWGGTIDDLHLLVKHGQQVSAGTILYPLFLSSGASSTATAAVGLSDSGRVIIYSASSPVQVAATLPPPPQWAGSAGGAWTSYLPSGTDKIARLMGAIASPQTITADNVVTVGTLRLDNENRYTLAGAGRLELDVSHGPAAINDVNGSHTIGVPVRALDAAVLTVRRADDVLTLSGGIEAAGLAVTKAGEGTLETTSLAAGGLSVTGGTLRLIAGGNGAAVDSVALSNGAVFDLGASRLAVATTDEAAIRGLMAGAYNHGRWDMPGIRSSALPGAAGVGFRVIDSQLVVRASWFGDADLDGIVTQADWEMIEAAMLLPAGVRGWSQGDFNYDGVVSADDFALMSLGIGSQTGTFPAAVPEPAFAAGLAALAGLHARRRR